MGMFSWTTADSQESISNRYSIRGAKTVYMLQPNGEESIVESNYDGYGVFGGVDAFVWLAKRNASLLGIEISNMTEEEIRSIGIDLSCDRNHELRYPLKFSFNKDAVYEHVAASSDCPDQGIFYDDAD